MSARGWASKRRVTFIEAPEDEPLPRLSSGPLLLPEWVEAGFVPVITEEDEWLEESDMNRTMPASPSQSRSSTAGTEVASSGSGVSS